MILKYIVLIYNIIKGILSHILLYISYLVPRNKNKYVLGCYTGFGDNSKYLFLELLQVKGILSYWYTENKKEYNKVKALGLPVIYCYSLKGLYHCLTAGNYVTTHNHHDYNEWTSGNVRIVSLWHGIGPKNMYVEPIRLNFIKRLIFKIINYKPTIDIALSTSDFITNIYSKSIGFDKNIAVYHSLPRCDFMLKKKADIIECLKSINDNLSIALINNIITYNKVIIYMPTWRDNNSDFIKNAGFDFEEFDSMLKSKGYVFIMKLHPNTHINIDELEGYNNILLIDKSIDIYPILPFTDMLVTDYSSIYYDYLLLNDKEVIFYTFDEHEYMTQCRDFVIDFHQVTPGTHIKSFEELYKAIKNDIKCPMVDKDKIIKIFWDKAKTPLINTLLLN